MLKLHQKAPNLHTMLTPFCYKALAQWHNISHTWAAKIRPKTTSPMSSYAGNISAFYIAILPKNQLPSNGKIPWFKY
jgi:hypothetical protein